MAEPGTLPAGARARFRAVHPVLLVVASLAVINLFVILLAWLSLYESRNQHHERARSTAENLSRLIEQSIGARIAQIDLSLGAVVDEDLREATAGGRQATALNACIARQLSRNPGLEALRIADADGVVAYGSGVVPGSRIGVEDRDYFLRLRQEPGAGLVLSGPSLGRISGKWVIILARGIRAPGGDFRGVAYAVLALEEIERIFSSLEVGPHGAIGLRDLDLRVIVRYPQGVGAASSIGSTTVSKELLGRVLAGHGSGSFDAHVTLDGVERTISFRRIKGYPLLVAVGLSREDYLVQWRREAVRTWALVGLCGFFTLVFLGVLLVERGLDAAARKVAEEALRDSMARLEESRGDLERLNLDLAERTRQAESSNRTKSEFLATMSHEIRTPMNGILGLCHLVLRTELSPKQAGYLTRIQSSSRLLLTILNDTLDLSKIEAGKVELERRTFTLRKVFDHVHDLTEGRAKEKGLAVHFILPSGLPGRLVGDGLRLGQVLLNLASNAVKFTDEGAVTVSVDLVSQEPRKVDLQFKIEDTGIGIPPDVLPRLFRSFSQADSSTTRRFGGTGLGLAISKRLVDLMGGTITVASEPGRGSTFAFTLPFGLGATESAGTSEDTDTAEPSPEDAQDQPRPLPADVDLGQVGLCLRELDQRLRRKSLSARKDLAALRLLLGADRHVILMEHALARMDFKKAHEDLAALAGALGITLSLP